MSFRLVFSSLFLLLSASFLNLSQRLKQHKQTPLLPQYPSDLDEEADAEALDDLITDAWLEALDQPSISKSCAQHLDRCHNLPSAISSKGLFD